jgi:Flp pilus assembly protein TadB
MERDTALSDSLIHAGAGTTIVFTYLGLIPGVLPILALTAVVTALLAAPLVILSLAVALLVGPPYAVWRLATRGRRRRQRPERATRDRAPADRAPQFRPVPMPSTHPH